MPSQRWENLITIGIALPLLAWSPAMVIAQNCVAGIGDCSRPLSSSGSTRPEFNPIPSMSIDRMAGDDRPATFGSITFRGSGTVCIGLLNRGKCNY